MEPREREALETQIRERLDADELEKAAEIAIENYGPELLGFLVRGTGNEDHATEIFAQFCENLWRNLQQFRGRSSFRTWAYKLAISARSRFYNDPYHRRKQRLDTSQLHQLRDQVRSSTLLHLRTEAKDELAQIRQRLKPRERELLVLRVDRKMSWNDIAQILSDRDQPLSPGLQSKHAAKWRQRYQRLNRKLRKLFAESGLLES